MSKDELRTSCERLRNEAYPRAAVSRGADWDSWYMPIQEMKDLRLAADAYLAEHPADDDEVADGAWLRSIGATRPQAAASETVYTLGEWKAMETGGCGTYPILLRWDKREVPNPAFIVSVFGGIVFARPTRGDIRRLCKALGIELKEVQDAT